MRDALAFPVPVSDRISIIYLERTLLERDGHALVSISGEVRTIIPVGNTATLMLGPGTTVSHAAIALCALEGVLLLWVGEGGVRLYGAGTSRNRAGAILRQASLRLDEASRLVVARKLFELMFGEPAPLRRSIEQLRGMEGARVKQRLYELANQYGVPWPGRTSDLRDPINLAISAASAALYGAAEAAILSLGYSPAIGFVHSGDPRSFVFDVADTVKFKTVVPLAFEVVSESTHDVERRVRTRCRDLFVNHKLVERLVTVVERVLNADGSD